MKCKESRRYINLFIDSELDSKASFEIAEHLSSCEDCNKRFKQEENIEKTLVSVLKDSKEPEAEETWERVLFRFKDQVGLKKSRRFGSWFYKRYVVPATAAILITAITLILYPRQGVNELTVAVQKCHMEYIAKEIAPSIESAIPDEITRYFSDKFLFPVVISEIPDFKSHHIKLFGGKVCHLNGISTAYTMYHCCNTPVSVFILSTKDAEDFSDIKQTLGRDMVHSLRKGGVNLVMTRAGQHTFVCVVADHDVAVLEWIASNFIKA